MTIKTCDKMQINGQFKSKNCRKTQCYISIEGRNDETFLYQDSSRRLRDEAVGPVEEEQQEEKTRREERKEKTKKKEEAVRKEINQGQVAHQTVGTVGF